MGSFWGLDNAGKEAQGWPREYGAWTSQQYKDWITKQNQQQSAGDAASEWYKNYQLNRAQNGVGDPTMIRGIGSQIMPGVNDYVTNKSGRIQQQIDDFSKLPSATDTMGKINAATDEKGNLIRQTRDANLADIGDTFTRANGFEDTAHNDMNSAYTSALKDAELLKPGSQFAQAQTARSFAGANASAAGALRRSGADMSSPQAIGLMQRNQQAQARAVDDKAAAGTKDYVDTRGGLLLGQGGESVRHAGAQSGNDLLRSQRTTGQQNDTLTRASDWEDERGRNAMMDKALQTQDWQTRGALNGQLSDAELEAIGLRQQEFNAGMGYQTADLNERNAGAAGVGQYGENQYNHSYQSSNAANASGDRAMNAYQTAYGYEAPQAGYGAKMLASVAYQGLGQIPVVGPMIQQGMTPVYQSGVGALGAQQGPGGSANPYGGYGGGSGGPGSGGAYSGGPGPYGTGGSGPSGSSPGGNAMGWLTQLIGLMKKGGGGAGSGATGSGGTAF